MKTKFAIGQELDIASGDEVKGAAGLVVSAILGLRQPPLVESVSYPFTSDANGNVGPGSTAGGETEVWRCPMGMRADLNRITLDIAGWPTTTPNTTGRLALRRDDTAGPLIYFWPQPSGNVAPSIESYGGDAPRLNGGQRLVLIGNGLTVSQSFTLNLQITLFENPVRERGESRY